MNDDIQACFRLFEIQPGASPEAVKQAYRDLVKIWHPDRFPNDPKFQKRANEKTKAINEAYRKILAYQSGNSSYSRARPSEEEGRTRASAEADAARRASEAAEAKAREAAILREQRRRRDEERRQAEERRREQEQARRQAMHTEANQSDDLSGSYAPINWQSAEASKEVFEFLAFAWKSAWIRANNNSFPAAFLGMLMSMNAFSHLKFWSQLLYAVSNSALCWLFSAVPVFLASLGYYAVSGRIPPQDNIIKLNEKPKSEALWKEFNWFTVLALSLAATWILFVTPSLFPEAKFPWTVVAEAVASKEPGNAEAQFRLGLKYSHGESVRQDHVEAAKWYRKAAEQGHAGAQNSLGVLYDTGQGVPQNHLEAAKWFARAAEQGEDYALNNLGIMYHNGHGVPQDFVEAYKWYCLAAAKGNTNALSNRDNLMRWLTSTQIAEGQRRAAAFVSRQSDSR